MPQCHGPGLGQGLRAGPWPDCLEMTRPGMTLYTRPGMTQYTRPGMTYLYTTLGTPRTAPCRMVPVAPAVQCCVRE